MRLRTILNQVQKCKSFVYGDSRFIKLHGKLCIEVKLEARKNSRPICSGCKKARSGYDRLPSRRFEFVPFWGMAVFFIYAMRRVNCPGCGVKVEQVPWADGKNQTTTTYQWFLAAWAKKLSWKQVASAFGTTWDTVYAAVMMAVVYGLTNRSLLGITAVGVDEIQWLHGHQYLTLVYEIGAKTKRLLYIGKERTETSLHTFFHLLGKKGISSLKYICTDMWQPYLNVIAQMAGGAIQILDRFHIMKKFNDAIDQVRREEVQRMKQQGMEPILRRARWCLLKRPSNLTSAQSTKLSELMGYNLRSIRAYILREEFQRFWDYLQPAAAGRFLDDWCKRATRSKLDPIKKIVACLRSHRTLLLNWFRAKGTMSSGAVESMNNNAKVVIRKSYGFRSFRAVELALYHTLGNLPHPKFTHKFF